MRGRRILQYRIRPNRNGASSVTSVETKVARTFFATSAIMLAETGNRSAARAHAHCSLTFLDGCAVLSRHARLRAGHVLIRRHSVLVFCVTAALLMHLSAFASTIWCMLFSIGWRAVNIDVPRTCFELFKIFIAPCESHCAPKWSRLAQLFLVCDDYFVSNRIPLTSQRRVSIQSFLNSLHSFVLAEH